MKTRRIVSTTPTATSATALTATLAIALGAGSAAGQSFTDMGLPPMGGAFTPVALSADGQVVAGAWQGARVMRWTQAGGFELAPTAPSGWSYTVPYGVSADGLTIVGDAGIGGLHAFTWTAAAGYVNLGVLPGGTHSEARAASADGSVVVGQSSDGTSIYKAMRWSAATGMRALIPAASSISDAVAMAVSADGSVIAGQIYTRGGYRAFRWTAAGGMVDLGAPPGLADSTATCMNADGSVISGGCGTGFFTRSRLFRWTAGGGMQDLGQASSDPNGSATAVAMSADGTVIAVGLGGISYPRATIWTTSQGYLDLNTALPAMGVDLDGWTLTHIYGLSADGRVMTGAGVHNNVQGTWVVGLPCLVAPGVRTQPASSVVCGSGTATYSTAASGTGPFTYRWQALTSPAGEFADLVDGPFVVDGRTVLVVDGAERRSVTLSLAAGAQPAWSVRCVIANHCGSTPTSPASLHVSAADFNCDGRLDPDDLSDFIGCYFSQTGSPDGCVRADFNGDGNTDPDDLADFIAAYFSGQG